MQLRPYLDGLPGERSVASPYNGLKVYERSSVEDEELKQLIRDRNVRCGEASRSNPFN